MKLGRDYSWWVEYVFEYEYFDTYDRIWCSAFDFDAGRFNRRKKDLKKAVTEHIKEHELSCYKYRNLRVRIKDCYMTTPTEV